MKKIRSILLCVVAFLLCAALILVCVAGFSACGGDEGEGLNPEPEPEPEPDEDCSETGNHTVESWTWADGIEANCGVSGTRIGTCTICGENVTEYVEATGDHTSDGGVVTTAATCGTAGETTYTCAVCGQVIATQTIAATGEHDYALDTESSEYKAATCAEDGANVYVCSVCGDTYTEIVEATGEHDWIVKDTTTATCTTAGAVDYVCSVCDETKTETIAALGHDYQESWIWKAESDGGDYTVTATLDTLVCSRCGDEKNESASAEGALNADGTYTVKVTASDGAEYEETSRVFATDDDGVKTDIGTGATYAPMYSGGEVASYELTKIPSETRNLYVAGNIDGLSVSVAGSLTSSNNTVETIVFEYGVTEIGDRAFYGASKLKSIEFCDTLTRIGGYAFNRCNSLLSVEIPSSVSSIGMYAFNGSESLKSVVIHGVKRNMTDIGNYAFAGCAALETVAFEGGTVSVGLQSFRDCTSLKCVKFYSGLLRAGTGQAINSYAFSGDTSLSTLIISGSVSIPNNINGVSETAFQNCPIADVYFDGNREGWETTKNIFNYNILRNTYKDVSTRDEYKNLDTDELMDVVEEVIASEGITLNIPNDCPVHYSSDEPVYGCWHWSGDEIVMWTEREEADARIMGSANFNEHDISTNFTIEEGLAFDGSSVTASFVEIKSDGTMIYELSGTSCAMGEELAAAFYNENEAAEHAECEYVTFMVNLYEDETATITTYNGDIQEKIWTDMNWHSDTAFVLDLTNHNEGDWSMVIDITRMDGSSVTYRLMLGTIEAGV